MNLTSSLLIYLTIGVGVGIALLAAEPRGAGTRSYFAALTALLFWPLYVPLLLSAPPKAAPTPSDLAHDPMAAAIAQVERELAAAFASLDGWAENVLDLQRDRLGDLKAALEAQAARIRDMDSLTAQTLATADSLPLDAAGAMEMFERFRHSEQARAQNLTRLAEVRRTAYADLMSTLAWIRELVSMIHLAKFTGAPAAQAEDLVAQIAAAVEGISAANWHVESSSS